MNSPGTAHVCMTLTSALYAYSTVYSNRGCLTPMGVAGEQVGGGGKGEGRPITSAIFGLRKSGLLTPSKYLIIPDVCLRSTNL